MSRLNKHIVQIVTSKIVISFGKNTIKRTEYTLFKDNPETMVVLGHF